MSFNEWKKYQLSEVINLIGGGTPKTSVSEYWNGEIPWLSVVDFGNKGKYVYETEKYITDKGLKESSTKILKKGQLIISARGTVGELAVLGREMAFNQSCYGITAKELAENDFLYYLLKFNIKQLKQNTHGSVFDTLTRQSFESIEVEIPNLKTQQRIASILSSIDDAIELNQQINKTLEEMAIAIFKEWFVDFNFPNATGKFQETEIGKIPVGWKVATFEDVFDADRGLSYKGAGLAESDATPMHNLNSVLEGGGYKTIGIKYYNGDYKDKHIVNAGEVIVANTEQGHKHLLIGYPAIVPQFYGEHGIFSHHIYRLRPKPNCYLSPDFIYHLLLQTQVREQVIGFANGTTVNMLKIEGLQKPKFAMPPKELAEKFTAIAQANRLQAEQNIEENQSLMNLRDTLLPKLMKGEININL